MIYEAYGNLLICSYSKICNEQSVEQVDHMIKRIFTRTINAYTSLNLENRCNVRRYSILLHSHQLYLQRIYSCNSMHSEFACLPKFIESLIGTEYSWYNLSLLIWVDEKLMSFKVSLLMTGSIISLGLFFKFLVFYIHIEDYIINDDTSRNLTW